MFKIYSVGDIFKIDQREYKLRVINNHKTCWLEPVIARYGDTCVSGGLNKTYDYDELHKLEYIDGSDKMKTFVIKVAQNGGEYYGHTTIRSKGDSYELKEGNIIVVDGVEIQFDEHIEVISIK